MKMIGFGWGNLTNKTTKFLEYLEAKDQNSVTLNPNYVNVLCVYGWENASVEYDINRILIMRILKL